MAGKNHEMNLTPSPLRMIRERKKMIELRLYDEKRQAVSIGDTITFHNTEDESDTLRVRVEDLYVFGSFGELYPKTASEGMRVYRRRVENRVVE